jgi:hypothetical protein
MDMSNSPRPVVAAYADSDARVLTVACLPMCALAVKPAGVDWDRLATTAADIRPHRAELIPAMLTGLGWGRIASNGRAAGNIDRGPLPHTPPPSSPGPPPSSHGIAA